MNKNSISERLSLREKIGYGVGDMASNFYMGFFALFLLYYYTDVYGISPAAAATMLLVTKVIDAISDPAMGIIADRTNSRWGKYRPYLLFVAIPYALLGYLLFSGPELSDFGKLAFAYISYTLVMLAYTAINVPYSALLAVISPSAEERTKATQFRFIFASLGTLSVSAFATPLVQLLGQGDELLGFRLTIVVFAVLSVILYWITFTTTRERIRPPKHTSTIREDFSALLRNISWQILVVTGILVVIGLVIRFASIVYYVKYNMNDDGELIFLIFDRTAVFTSMGLIGQLLGAMSTPLLVRHFEKRTLMIFMNILHACTLVMCFFLPPDNYALVVAVHAVGIFTFGVVITLLFSMYTDCSEYGEWLTRKNTAGLVVSASMFSLKFGSAVGGALPGFLLAAYGFVANATQTQESLDGIRFMFNLLPAIFFAGAALVMFFYQLDNQSLSKVEAELAQRRHAAAS